MASKQHSLRLIDAGSKIRRPPWSGCSLFTSPRWARPVSSRSPPAEDQGSDKPPPPTFLGLDAPLSHHRQRLHAIGDAGGQDTLPIGCGSPHRTRQADRPALIVRGHRVMCLARTRSRNASISVREDGAGIEAAISAAPRSARRALILGSARPALISLLSLSTISAGVFFGAPMPNQPLTS